MLRLALVLPSLALLTSVAIALGLPIAAVDRTGNAAGVIARWWARLFLLIAGVRVQVEGLDRLDRHGSYVFVANHESLFDVPLVVAHLPFQLRMFGKVELFRIPFFGWALRLAGYILIDRSDRAASVASIDRAVRRFGNRRVSIVVFPEGTRSVDGELGPLKKGGFVMAIQMRRSIVPVTIIGTRFIAKKKSLKFRPGVVRLIVGSPLSTAGVKMEDKNALVERVRKVMEEEREGHFVLS